MTAQPRARMTLRRKVSAVVLGFFYGGVVVNGVEDGIDMFRKDGGGLSGRPILGSVTLVGACALAGSLAGHSSQTFAFGVVACGTILPAFLLGFAGPFTVAAAAVAIVLGIAGSVMGARIPLPERDVSRGRLFGVRWAHWLWLFVPWELTIANAVWLAWPTQGLSTDIPAETPVATALIRLVVASAVTGTVVGQCLASLAEDERRSRLLTALRFLAWLVVFPAFVRFTLYG